MSKIFDTIAGNDTLTYLLVNNTGEELQPPFAIRKDSDDLVADLAISIAEQNKNTLGSVDAPKLILWKPHSFPCVPSSPDTRSDRARVLFNTPVNQRHAVLLEMWRPLVDFFPPSQSLTSGYVHVIVQLPEGTDLGNVISFESI
jgi:hypothetical protein